MKPGADTVAVIINGQVIEPPIGLDNVYRVQKQAGVFAPGALRGYWEDDTATGELCGAKKW